MLLAMAFLCVSLFAWFFAAFPLQTPTRGFKAIEFPGAMGTGIASITSTGAIGGSYVNPYGSVHGFLFKDGQFTTIDFPGATTTELTWINDRGYIVGGYNDGGGNGNRGFLLSQGTFTSIEHPDVMNTIATGI